MYLTQLMQYTISEGDSLTPTALGVVDFGMHEVCDPYIYFLQNIGPTYCLYCVVFLAFLQ